LRGDHHPGVIPENIKTALPRQEFLGRSLDCCEVIQLEMQKDQFPRRASKFGLDLPDSFLGLGLRPSCDIYFGTVLI
jgi:hypothetical protein